MIKSFVTIMIFGFSTVIGAKSISDQIRDDKLEVVIDYSALIDKKLVSENICNSNYSPTRFNSSGVAIKMLGYAHVYMGAGPGISKFGHLGERFVYCKGSELFDMYYDGIKLTEGSISLFQADYPDASIDYIRSPKAFNSIYYRKIQDPTQVNVYGSDTIRNNRNIYEQWLKISEKEMYELLLRNINRVAAQAKLVSGEEQLPKFRDLSNNCTDQVTEDLKSVQSFRTTFIKDPSSYDTSGPANYVYMTENLNTVVPKSVYLALSEAKVTELLVIYPSQDNTRKILFNKHPFADAIKILEVPAAKINPKFAPDWTEEELKEMEARFDDYQSPLASHFADKITHP